MASLKLVLSAGTFSVVVDRDGVATCYTDSTGTSRSASCSSDTFEAWAEAALIECKTFSVKQAPI